jgi:cytochrome c556
LGTTRFAPAARSDGASDRSSVAALKQRHPEFDQLRLIKSDTDGFDSTLVPAAARMWRASAPVLFFEFDPALARRVQDHDPHQLWKRLSECGYSQLAIWDNTGDALGRLHIDEVAAHATQLEPPPVRLGYHFWDVAACRADDRAALEAFGELMAASFDLRGHRRAGVR